MMDKLYLTGHLLSYSKIWYGKENRENCFSKKKGKYYLFGYKKDEEVVMNKVTKEVAIYICINQIRKKHYKEQRKLKRKRRRE